MEKKVNAMITEIFEKFSILLYLQSDLELLLKHFS